MEAIFIYFLVIIFVATIILLIIKTFKEIYFKKHPETFNIKFILSLFLYLILIYFGTLSFFVSRAEKYEKENKVCFYIKEYFQGRIIEGDLCFKYLNKIDQIYFLYFSILMAIIFLVMIRFRSIKNPKSIQILFNEKVDHVKLEDLNKIRPWFLAIAVISFLVFALLIIIWGINN